MTPREKKHVMAALEWLEDAQVMIQRRDLVDTSDSVIIAKRELRVALAVARVAPEKKAV